MRQYIFILLLLIPANVFAAGDDFHLPDRSLTQISDEHNLLPIRERQDWEYELTALLKDYNINLRLVVLPSLYNTQPDFVAQKIGDAWGDKLLQGIIVYVPLQKNTPVFWMGGSMTTDFHQDPRRKNAMLLKMQKRVAGEISEPDKIHAAISEMSDALRILKSTWAEYKTIYDTARREAYEQNVAEYKNQRIKKILIVSVAALIFLVLPFIYLAWRNRVKVCYFPATSARRRFGAPYAGGNSVSVTLTSRSS